MHFTVMITFMVVKCFFRLTHLILNKTKMHHTALCICIIFFSDFKSMLDAKGTTEVIKSVARLNICRNYFKHMKKKNDNVKDQ